MIQPLFIRNVRTAAQTGGRAESAQDYASADYNETELELSGYEDLYSGMIKAVRWHGPVEPGKSHAYAFRYDERYQLLDANWADVDGSSLTFSGEAYRETIGGYDKNSAMHLATLSELTRKITKSQVRTLLAEVPVYGSGRIGMYKPAYRQTLYEVTDHLGNVRAVIGGSVQTTMLATMEKERQEKESQDFFGMRTTVSATDINHTGAR